MKHRPPAPRSALRRAGLQPWGPSLWVLVALLPLCAGACGGSTAETVAPEADSGNDGEGEDGGDDADEGSDGGESAASEPYLFFDGSLHAIDPADPTAVLTLSTAQNILAAPLLSGTRDAATGRLKEPAISDVFYAVGSSLRHVDPDNRPGEPGPRETLVISDLGAEVISLEPSLDFENLGRSRLVAELANGSTVVVRVDTGAAALFPGPAPFAELHDPATGALLGWFQVDAFQLNFVRPDLTAFDVGNAFGTTQVVQTSTSTAFILTGNELFRFDPSTLALVGPDASFESPQFLTSDGTSLFAFVPTSSQVEFKRFETNGTLAVDTVLNGLPTGGLAELAAVGDRIVIHYFPAGSSLGSLFTVRKDGTGLVALSEQVSSSSQLVFHAGRVFFNTENGALTSAHAALLDGSGDIVRNDAAWVGSAQDEIGPDSFNVSRLFILGFPETGATTGAALFDVDPNTPETLGVELGRLPTNAVSMFFGLGLRDAQLAAVLVEDGSQTIVSTDIFFVDAEANSLQRVTDTAGHYEFPISISTSGL